MAGKDRKKELARQRYLRQQARREAEARKARRIRVVGSAVAVALLAGGGFGIVALVGGDEGAKADPAASTPPPEDGKPKQEIALQKVSVSGEEGGSAKCKYPDSDNDQGAPKGLDKPPATAVYDGKVTATLKTSLGDVKIEMDADKAPCTVNSFAHLAEEKFFENVKCHRLTTAASLKVLQCGDPTGSGAGGPGYRFANENTKGAKYTRGVVAMAHSMEPDSNGSQFFIVHGDSELPADYTIFGKITSGMDVIDKVAQAGVAAQ
ncbi:peptidylprolyl isomerase [Thermomonospora cellulosilytica]|uniref:Peptidyl-prolyl cis-trans isomerase n=1 Tax=Thermomonospora cellulosilytica TaxID=1411118 RepID=A0A7W3R9T9_9ACTN|nr:peptidylprolyl isomerase [Thermomonospora cellulosilytica]MBA9005117.1 peptidyl-prolyl cis-trans isomerase B (cyclophilin B) [Thermomonospora cellulosilytica]